MSLFAKADLVTVKIGVIALNPGNSILDSGLPSPVKAMPTAPDEYTFPFWNNVIGLPVMNGVEEAKRPSLDSQSHYNNTLWENISD